ncbi:MAG TPA: hypothetical protein DEH25_09180 [Chloroflexi bacterium]|nr:hypothetical protein [Chloroflexota bacterium]HBY07915.1 hypothetical protein [Chloroflexota bacterium]
MWNRLKTFFQPPVFEGDEEKTQSARLLHSFLLIIIGISVLYPVISYLAGNPLGSNVMILVITIAMSATGLSLLLRSGSVIESGVILCLVIWAVFTFGAYSFGGLHDTSITGFMLVIVLASLVGGRRVLLAFGGLSLFSLVGLYIVEQLEVITPKLAVPSDAADIALPIVVVIGTTFLLRIFVNYLTSAYEQVRSSANQIEAANLELESSRDSLAEQTKILERRTKYLEASAAVSRDVAAELDPKILLQRVTSLVTNQFNFYHTGIFLIDPGGEFAILQAASSEGGQRMLARGHRLRVGQEGLVGYVSDTGNSRIALDTGDDAVYFNNPDLPETRSETALPLRVRGEVIGVLDVQSVESNAFSQDDISVLETLADQIANALHTARLFQQVDESLEIQRRVYEETSRETWQRLTKNQKEIGYQYIRGQVIPTQTAPVVGSTNLPEIAVPIRIGTQVIGHITAHKEISSDLWNRDDIATMENLSSQLSVALESARLYQDSQLRATREQITGEVTSKIRETLDIDTIIKTASDEIRKALNLPEVVIRLGEPPSEQNRGATE